MVSWCVLRLVLCGSTCRTGSNVSVSPARTVRSTGRTGGVTLVRHVGVGAEITPAIWSCCQSLFPSHSPFLRFIPLTLLDIQSLRFRFPSPANHDTVVLSARFPYCQHFLSSHPPYASWHPVSAFAFSSFQLAHPVKVRWMFCIAFRFASAVPFLASLRINRLVASLAVLAYRWVCLPFAASLPLLPFCIRCLVALLFGCFVGLHRCPSLLSRRWCCFVVGLLVVLLFGRLVGLRSDVRSVRINVSRCLLHRCLVVRLFGRLVVLRPCLGVHRSNEPWFSSAGETKPPVVPRHEGRLFALCRVDVFGAELLLWTNARSARPSRRLRRGFLRSASAAAGGGGSVASDGRDDAGGVRLVAGVGGVLLHD